jgi:hypothetical protein
MSRYLSGKQAMPIDISRAVSDYIGVFDPNEQSEAADASQDAPTEDGPGPDFAGMVRRLTDEPLLGPRQGALVDALIDRLRSGSPLSGEDKATVTSLMQVLGIR